MNKFVGIQNYFSVALSYSHKFYRKNVSSLLFIRLLKSYVLESFLIALDAQHFIILSVKLLASFNYFYAFAVFNFSFLFSLLVLCFSQLLLWLITCAMITFHETLTMKISLENILYDFFFFFVIIPFSSYC